MEVGRREWKKLYRFPQIEGLEVNVNFRCMILRDIASHFQMKITDYLHMYLLFKRSLAW